MIDLNVAMDRLRALVRLRGREDGEAWQWFEGILYGRAEGDVLRAICGFTSVLCVRYEAADHGVYRFAQRESNHYTDLATGRPIGDVRNPYTGKTNIAVGYVSPKFKFQMSQAGVATAAEPERITGHIPSSFSSDGRDIWTTESRANEFGAGIAEEEFPEAYAGPVRKSADVATYRADRAAILDPSVPFVRASLQFVADTPWVLWMMMGRSPGHMMWIGQGTKFETRAELPADVCARVEQVHPGFLADPWGLKATAYSTVRQLRDLRAAGRI
ncbi:MAG: DUF1838 family protein [Rhodospirillaceae bacterium]|nr:DUF1838 family protein [Rhodospirillaceae bacterium]